MLFCPDVLIAGEELLADCSPDEDGRDSCRYYEGQAGNNVAIERPDFIAGLVLHMFLVIL